MTHAPEPWKILRHDLGDEEILFVPVEILAGNGKLVVAHEGGLAPINQEWTCEEIEANGSLIEAAPDMLKALEWYGWKVEESRKNTLEGDRARYDLDRDGGSRAYAVIKKARGEE